MATHPPPDDRASTDDPAPAHPDASPERSDPVTERTGDGAGEQRSREMRENLRDAEGDDTSGSPGSAGPDSVS